MLRRYYFSQKQLERMKYATEGKGSIGFVPNNHVKCSDGAFRRFTIQIPAWEDRYNGNVIEEAFDDMMLVHEEENATIRDSNGKEYINDK